jgi:hypothetical protein
MTWHKLLPGVILPIVESLRNVVLVERIQQRSTVLSFGALIENICAASLVLFGAGLTNNGIGFWIYPAVAVLISTIFMVVSFYSLKFKQTQSSPVELAAQKNQSCVI